MYCGYSYISCSAVPNVRFTTSTVSVHGHSHAASMCELFTECVPGDSVTTLELQVADLLAYEGFKLLNETGRSDGQMRAALRKLLGSKTPIQLTRFTDQNFQDLRQMIDNNKAGLPTDQGVTSKLEVSVGALDPIGLVIDNR